MAQSKAFANASHAINELSHSLALLEAENAKLRKLALDMGELLDVFTECDLTCKHYHDGCIGDCYYVNARRRLGIEVSK